MSEETGRTEATSEIETATKGALGALYDLGKQTSSWAERDAKREAQAEADRIDFAKRCEETRQHNAGLLATLRSQAEQQAKESEVRIAVMPREALALERIATALEGLLTLSLQTTPH